jgi:hypothetical protein
MSWNDNGWNYWDDYNERDTEHVETISSKNIRTCKKNGNYKAMVACLGTMHPITEDKKTDIPYKQICAIAFQTVSELYSYTHGKSISKKSISEFIRELKFDIVTYNTMENS